MFAESIPIEWFNRYKNKHLLCRKPGCNRKPKSPYHFYCCGKHRSQFDDHCCNFIYWNTAKDRALYRDEYTCKLCGLRNNPYDTDPSKPYDYTLIMEVDHIKPRAVIKWEMSLEYKKLSPRQQRKKVNFRRWNMKYLETANAPENLRTLCPPCHKLVTADFLSSKLGRLILQEKRKDGSRLNKDYYWKFTSDYLKDYGAEYRTGFYIRERNEELTPEELKQYELHEYFSRETGLFAALVFWDHINETVYPQIAPPDSPDSSDSSLDIYCQV